MTHRGLVVKKTATVKLIAKLYIHVTLACQHQGDL